MKINYRMETNYIEENITLTYDLYQYEWLKEFCLLGGIDGMSKEEGFGYTRLFVELEVG